MHWAHSTNYEDFVKFIGNNLEENILKEYLMYAESHKNATYLSQKNVTLFITTISNWMRQETMTNIRDCDDFTLLLDESTDEGNRSELSLFCRIVKDGDIVNHFLDLMRLRRCDAQTIFNTVTEFLKHEDIDIGKTRFAGMDGCPAMSGEHNGVKSYFESATTHFAYIHCRNHRLALCFTHLIPEFEEFRKFDGLLLNLYLLLKHSSVKQSIFEEVQAAYNLSSLKLIKASVTRWLSHGKAAQRLLDRYEALVAALDTIYLRKQEPGVRGLRDDLVKPNVIATICFLTDLLQSTNVLQTFLQGERLNFLSLPSQVEKLVNTLRLKATNPKEPHSCYFNKLNEYIEIASRSAGVRYNSRSYVEFNEETFIENTAKPFLLALITEIEEAFQIPEHLKGFTVLDPVTLPTDGGKKMELSKSNPWLPSMGLHQIQTLIQSNQHLFRDFFD